VGDGRRRRKSQMACATMKGFGFFLTLRSHIASVNSKLRHIVLLYASVGYRPEAKRPYCLVIKEPRHIMSVN